MPTELEELRVLQSAEQFSDEVWRIVAAWEPFARDVVGKQITRAADSIGANIAEAYGRFHYGEKINLLYYSRGSVYETKYWLNRCHARNLMNDAISQEMIQRLVEVTRQINSFVANLKSQRSQHKPKSLREDSAEYNTNKIDAVEIFTASDLAWLLSDDPAQEPPLEFETAVSSL
ncbi:MAG: four helix bundle protein [Anaerolineae bacterium]|nr:four helix bundle protein [Anaerolineae bacterium]